MLFLCGEGKARRFFKGRLNLSFAGKVAQSSRSLTPYNVANSFAASLRLTAGFAL